MYANKQLKKIIEHLDVFQSNTLECWYDYFCTGDPNYFLTMNLDSIRRSIQ